MCLHKINNLGPSPRSHSSEEHDLALMASEQASPNDLDEAVVLMRRWTRLPANRKPEVHFRYKGMGSRSTLGFLVWLADTCGNRIYSRLRDESPIEAAEFRHQVLALCSARAEWLSRMGGSGLVHAFSRGLARYAQHLPETILDDAPMTADRRNKIELKALLADKLAIFVREAQRYAHQIRTNSRLIQKQLPSTDIDNEQTKVVRQVCASLMGVKHDIIHELDELEDHMFNPGAPVAEKQVERIVEWIREDLHELDNVVGSNEAEGESTNRPRTAHAVVAESAANVRQAFTPVAAAAEAYQAACERGLDKANEET